MISKKIFVLLMLICGLFFVFVSGCTSNNADVSEAGAGDEVDSSLSTSENILSSGAESDDVAPVELSDFEIEACNAAHEAGTCDTKLKELAIVSKDDCCASLSKCCD